MSDPSLAVRGVTAYYGNIIALQGVDIDVDEGEIVALIGANGAGKSTMMMTIFGDPRARDGRIIFDGRDITSAADARDRAPAIAQSPEGRRIFPRMTVYENLQMGASLDGMRAFRRRTWSASSRSSRGSRSGLTSAAARLSGGEQQMLAIARALMSRPRLLLLDEPSLGLAPLIVKQIFAVIRELNAQRGHHRLPGRAERLSRAEARASRLRHGRPAASRSPAPATSCWPIREVQAAYLEGGRH